MLNPVIRKATVDDAGAVSRLLVETWHDTYDPILGREKVAAVTARWHAPERLAEQIALPDAVFLVAEADAEAEGALVGHAFARMDRDGIVHLSRLYVAPRRQRRGIGERLMTELLAFFPQAERVRLEVEEANVKARRFYEKHGFGVAGRTGDCGGDSGVPALILEKSLSGEEPPASA